ncbi:hypothetical protein OROGR_031192 [Orobanche gracilis]
MGEEGKRSEETKKEKSEEALKAENPTDDGKKEEDGKKSETPKAEEQLPPPPPQEIVLKVYMHCEGCARKVRRCLKGFQGVEDVITDCRTGKVIVKGENADPLKVLERIQRKSHRQVELISPIPKPPSDEPPNEKTQDKEVAKLEEKKEEPIVITVVLGVYMHCEACAQEIKKRIMRMKGVESVDPDLKSSKVKVKGVIEPEKLVDYIHKRTGKHATITGVEPEKKKDEKTKEGTGDKKPEEAEKEKEAKKGDESKQENKEAGADGGGGARTPEKLEVQAEGEDTKLEVRRNEFYYYPQFHHQHYPQRSVQEYYYAYPPQIFSDENPNACSVM